MPLDPQQEQSLLQQSVAALQQGRAGEARARLEQLVQAGSANPIAWLLLAIALRTLKDPAEEGAVDRLLQLDPRSLRGLIMKADCRVVAGDQGGARQYYRTALGIAENSSVPPDAAPEVDRARKVLAELDELFHAKREQLMTRRGFPADSWSPRFARALDIAAGKRRQYFQRPTIFTYPELPHIQYYDPAEFDWTTKVEAATATARAELVELLRQQGDGDFRPYIQSGDGDVRLDANKGLVENRDWSALFLSENGKPDEALIARCPAAWAAVNQAPLVKIPGWGPTVMFSLLKAGARIEPHTGMFNTRLVCHLPLIVPPGCTFRVGNEIREWREGKLFIFDDTIEHEAWNDSGEDRVVLIFDIWRPELSERERAELTALLSAG